MPKPLKWELYNLADDRCELSNLAEKHPQRLASMISQWEHWAKRVGVTWEPYETRASVSSKHPTGTVADAIPLKPPIANRLLKLQVEVQSDNPHGVAIAQGGNQHGYALHFVNGKPAFDVRINDRVRRLMSETKVKGKIMLPATLTAKKMTLSINRGDPITCVSPGLIPAEPLDLLSIGFDDRSAAGNYQSPNRFNGKVLNHSVTSAVVGSD